MLNYQGIHKEVWMTFIQILSKFIMIDADTWNTIAILNDYNWSKFFRLAFLYQKAALLKSFFSRNVLLLTELVIENKLKICTKSNLTH